MSGGSMGYLSSRVASAEFVEDSVLRRAFREHLRKVAAAMHAIEWNDSGDGHSGEDELIRELVSRTDELQQALADAQRALDELRDTMTVAESRRW